MQPNPIFVPMTVSTDSVEIGMNISSSAIDIPVETGVVINVETTNIPAYTGDYVVTPSMEEQVLETNGLRMTDNVTINPIPSNYGLITWNGSFLTVS